MKKHEAEEVEKSAHEKMTAVRAAQRDTVEHIPDVVVVDLEPTIDVPFNHLTIDKRVEHLAARVEWMSRHMKAGK